MNEAAKMPVQEDDFGVFCRLHGSDTYPQLVKFQCFQCIMVGAVVLVASMQFC